MSSTSSRWIALLGLLAIAGYQNRDKLREVLGGASPGGMPLRPPSGNQPSATPPAAPQPQAGQGGGGFLDELRNIFTGGGSAAPSGGAAGGGLAGSVSDILNQFNQAGHGDVANSWVKDGPERQPTTNELENALGQDGLDALTKQTGLSRDELLKRLQAVLPSAIDQLTPEGRVPTPAEAAGFFGRA